MHAITLLTLLTSAPLALTGSVKVPPDQRIAEREEPGAAPEQWTIPDMKLHFMTQFTGIPGENSWPEEKGFDSEISFEVRVYISPSLIPPLRLIRVSHMPT
jgi:hypothetical protein